MDDPMEVELFKASTAHPRDSARYVAALEEAVLTRLADPGTVRHPALTSLYWQLVWEYQVLHRWEDALHAADAFVEAATNSSPDPRCLRAEVLMGMGRAAEAESIWTTVRTDTPDDVWLYNAAGLAYTDIGDHETALAWLTDGLEVALRIEDAETENPLADQLAELRQETLDRLGRPADAVQKRAIATLREQAEREHLKTLAEYGFQPGQRPVRPKAFTWLAGKAGTEPTQPPNAPCRCGSGRNHKFCCGAHQDIQTGMDR